MKPATAERIARLEAENAELRRTCHRLQSEVDGIFGNDLTVLRGRVSHLLIALQQLDSYAAGYDEPYRDVYKTPLDLVRTALGDS